VSEYQLIPITLKKLAGESVQTVDARALHEFLKIDTAFHKWIDRRLAEYEFEEGKDHWPILANRKFGFFEKETTEYALTLDMARELAMVERNEQGRQARRYFIACEKALREEASVCGGVPALLAGQLERLLADTGGLNRAQEARLVQQLKLAAITRRPLRARVVQACGWGWDWDTLRDSSPGKRRALLKAVRDCVALGLIEQAPAGTPFEKTAVQGEVLHG